MKEYIKKFSNPIDADQYLIKDIPFITTIASTGQNLHCNVNGKKLEEDDGVVLIKSANHFYEINNLVDCEINMVFCATSDQNEFVKLKIITENDKKNVYGIDANGNTESLKSLAYNWYNLYITEMPTGEELVMLNTIATEIEQGYKTYYSYGNPDREFYVWNGQERGYGHSGGYMLYLTIDYPDKSEVECEWYLEGDEDMPEEVPYDSENECWYLEQVFDIMMIITFRVNGEEITFGFEGD